VLSIAQEASGVVSGASGQRSEERAVRCSQVGLAVNFFARRAPPWFSGQFSVNFHTAALADKAALDEDGNSHDEITHGSFFWKLEGWNRERGNCGSRVGTDRPDRTFAVMVWTADWRLQ
jgi:hypothetical protein